MRSRLQHALHRRQGWIPSVPLCLSCRDRQFWDNVAASSVEEYAYTVISVTFFSLCKVRPEIRRKDCLIVDCVQAKLTSIPVILPFMSRAQDAYFRVNNASLQKHVFVHNITLGCEMTEPFFIINRRLNEILPHNSGLFLFPREPLRGSMSTTALAPCSVRNK